MDSFPHGCDLELMAMLARQFPRKCFDERQMQHFINSGGTAFLRGLFRNLAHNYSTQHPLPKVEQQFYIPLVGKKPANIEVSCWEPPTPRYFGPDIPWDHNGVDVELRPYRTLQNSDVISWTETQVGIGALYSLMYAYPFPRFVSILYPKAAWSDGEDLYFPYISGGNGSWAFNLCRLSAAEAHIRKGTWMELQVLRMREDTGF